jgi:hypothetical protein
MDYVPHFTNKDLLRKIDLKRSLLEQKPEYYLCRRNRVLANNSKIGKVYSWWIANPFLRLELCEEEGEDAIARIRALSKMGIMRIENAWNYLRGAVDYSGKIMALSKMGIMRIENAWNYLRGAVDYSGKSTAQVLSKQLLIELAKRVDPRNEGIRHPDEIAQIWDGEYLAPEALQVEPMLEGVLARLRKSSAHALDEAAYVHASIVSIQPFARANKRLSRILQDSILVDGGLPPATIEAGEQRIYYDLLKQCVIGCSEKDHKACHAFFDYIAGKVNDSLDEMLNDLILR